ncbi:hypothetical protein GGS20DRAFT_315124 [Poronia punctata]|nr:hypothetical protein GGS20DRAFT_315124 [Poronia punctata]
MKTSTISSLALALGVGVGVTAASNPKTSKCPYNYPTEIRTTSSHSGLTFHVRSNNPATSDRALQLRANPNFPGSYFVGIDASSPVLVSNLRDGALASYGRNEFNQLFPLGPTAYLNQRDEFGNAHRYTVGFANGTDWPGQVEAEWSLSGGAFDGSYYLYHDEPIGVAHGFLLCVADHDVEGPGGNGWFQLYYNTYLDEPYDYENCEYVGVETTVAPTIENGVCSI